MLDIFFFFGKIINIKNKFIKDKEFITKNFGVEEIRNELLLIWFDFWEMNEWIYKKIIEKKLEQIPKSCIYNLNHKLRVAIQR